MSRILALTWKEWRELRWLLVLGLIVFTGLPTMAALVVSMRNGEPLYWGFDYEMVGILAPLVALLLGTAAGVRDMRQGVRSFWQSRPVGLLPWVLVRYLAGLAVMLIVCLMPLAVEAVALGADPGRHWYTDYGMRLLAAFPLGLTAIYSVSFALGCLVRRGAHAAMLSFAACLLILFLPLLSRSLSSLSLLNILEERWHVSVEQEGGPPVRPGHLAIPIPGSGSRVEVSPQYQVFAGAMLLGSALALGLAWLAVRRDWQVRTNGPLLCWAVGLTGLVLFGSAASQIGSNLPVERQLFLAEGGPRFSGAVFAIN